MDIGDYLSIGFSIEEAYYMDDIFYLEENRNFEEPFSRDDKEDL